MTITADNFLIEIDGRALQVVRPEVHAVDASTREEPDASRSTKVDDTLSRNLAERIVDRYTTLFDNLSHRHPEATDEARVLAGEVVNLNALDIEELWFLVWSKVPYANNRVGNAQRLIANIAPLMAEVSRHHGNDAHPNGSRAPQAGSDH